MFECLLPCETIKTVTHYHQRPYVRNVTGLHRMSVGTIFFNKMEQVFKVRPKLKQNHSLSGTIISKQHFAPTDVLTICHVTY